IVGNGATVDANGIDRVFDLRAPWHIEAMEARSRLVLADLIVTGGVAEDGAAVLGNDESGLMLTDVWITANTATAGAPISTSEVLGVGTTISGNTGTTAGAIDVREAGT